MAVLPLPELCLLISQINPSIICIQESHLSPAKKINVPNYLPFCYDYTHNIIASGGVLILVHNSIFNPQVIQINTDIQQIIISATIPSLHHSPLTICNIYITPNQSLHQNEISNLFFQLPSPFLICGDFNAHIKTWGSLSNNSRGNQIDKILLDNPNILLLTNNHPTHFNISSGSLSTIDLSFSSSLLRPKLVYKVINDLQDSDHFPIKITTPLQKFQTPNNIRKWITDKADWSKFYKSTQIYYSSPPNINDGIQQLNNLILTAAENSIPRTSNKRHNKKKTVPWWTESIKESIKNWEKAFKTYIKSKLQEDLIKFRKHRAIARKTICNGKEIARKNSLNLSISTHLQQLHGKKYNLSAIISNTTQILNK